MSSEAIRPGRDLCISFFDNTTTAMIRWKNMVPLMPTDTGPLTKGEEELMDRVAVALGFTHADPGLSSPHCPCL